MRHILVYSDSLTWGIIPTTRNRLDFDARWPGVMELELLGQGHSVRVIEDCLNGRRTVWEHRSLGKALAHEVGSLPAVLKPSISVNSAGPGEAPS